MPHHIQCHTTYSATPHTVSHLIQCHTSYSATPHTVFIVCLLLHSILAPHLHHLLQCLSPWMFGCHSAYKQPNKALGLFNQWGLYTYKQIWCINRCHYLYWKCSELNNYSNCIKHCSQYLNHCKININSIYKTALTTWNIKSTSSKHPYSAHWPGDLK